MAIKGYEVHTSNHRWCMVTDIDGLKAIFRLYPEAIRRIEGETQHGGTCELFISQGPNPWGSSYYLIKRA